MLQITDLSCFQPRYEGEPMAQIYGKYDRSDTDEFPSVPWTLGWIQMRYEGEPMAQIK